MRARAKRALRALERLCRPPELEQYVGTVAVRLRKLRCRGEGAIETFQRRGCLAEFLLRQREVHERCGLCRVHSKRFLEPHQRPRPFTLLHVQDTEQHEYLNVVRLRVQEPPIHALRLGHAPLLMQRERGLEAHDWTSTFVGGGGASEGSWMRARIGFRSPVNDPEPSKASRLPLSFSCIPTAPIDPQINRPGPYLVLMKWYPGWFSAPHSYATDRSNVLSGTWVNSGPDFTPELAVPVHAGGYVLRVARRFHYDEVPHGIKEPVVIAVFGISPVDMKLADPKPPPRSV